jgi:Ca-activated chloride channel homolog
MRPSTPLFATLFVLAPGLAQAGVLLPTRSPTTPLKVRKEQITVRVSNQVLQARVNQVFENQTAKAVEGTYLFRPPAGAAVAGFATWVGGRKIESRVQEKSRARSTYEAARRAGGAPALLSQLRRGAFSMRVARIAPGQTRRVELRYEGVLRYRDGTVSLRLPLGLEGVKRVTRGDLKLDLEITDTKPITAVRASGLPAKVTRLSDRRWRVSYASTGARPPSDLRLSYDVRSKDIGLTFLTHRKAGEDGYFMLMASPQELTTHADIVKKDVVFVFDVSGSMQGEKIRQARGALKRCLGFMNRGDRFGIVAFSDGINPYRSRLEPLAPAAVRKAEAFIDGLQPMGGTNIHMALTEGLKLLGRSSRPKVLVFLTDGQATIGITDSLEIVYKVKRANTSGGRIFTFGVGADVNRGLLERVGVANRGAVDFITRGSDLSRAVAAFYNKIARPVLSDLALDFGGVTAAMTYPNVLPDLYKGSQLLLVGRYRGHAEARASLSGQLNGARKRFRFKARFPAAEAGSAFLPRLWAHRRITYLLSQMRIRGETTEGKAEVVRLAKRHHIATRYTSLVASAPRRMARLSPARVKPGDPAIRIRAPRDARAVTVIFPFGVTKAARFEPDQEIWSVRFLIPRGTPDGSYAVTIVVTAAAGQQQRYRVHYTVDTAAPLVKLAWEGPLTPGATVKLTARQIVTERDLKQAPNYRPGRRAARLRRLYAAVMRDARQVLVRTPDGQMIRLVQRTRGGAWAGAWTIPPTLASAALRGAALELMATDVAGNRSSAKVSLAGEE